MRKYIIPPGWMLINIGRVLKRVRNPVDVLPNSLYREIGIRSHGKGIFYKKECSGVSLGNKSVFWIEPDCFIVNIVFAWEQAIAKTTANEIGMIASHRFPMYKPIAGTLDLDYIVYFFKTPFGKHLLGLASPGGAGRNKTLGQEEFQSLAIPLPPYSEQSKIAEIISTCDEAITHTECLIAGLQTRKKGLMQHLLTGQVRFPEFGGEWKEVRLDEIATVIMGQSPSSSAYNETGIGLPLIQGNADISNRRTMPKVYTSEITKQCNVGDIILSVRAPVGETAISIHKACIGRGVCAIRVYKCDSRFLYHLLVSCEQRWQHYAQGSTFTAINSTDIRQLTLLIPTLIQEQERIAKTLNACDAEIDLLAKKLESIKQEKKGLMQRLLTGNLRVRV